MSTSKKTRGFLELEGLAAGDAWDIFTAGTGQRDTSTSCARPEQTLLPLYVITWQPFTRSSAGSDMLPSMS